MCRLILRKRRRATTQKDSSYNLTAERYHLAAAKHLAAENGIDRWINSGYLNSHIEAVRVLTCMVLE